MTAKEYGLLSNDLFNWMAIFYWQTYSQIYIYEELPKGVVDKIMGKTGKTDKGN